MTQIIDGAFFQNVVPWLLGGEAQEILEESHSDRWGKAVFGPCFKFGPKMCVSNNSG